MSEEKTKEQIDKDREAANEELLRRSHSGNSLQSQVGKETRQKYVGRRNGLRDDGWDK